MRKVLLFLLMFTVLSSIGIIAFWKFYILGNITMAANDLEKQILSENCKIGDQLKYEEYGDTSPNWEPNNKFGIYVYAENSDYIELAQNLVNAKTGEWGYVLIPYNMTDRDKSKWSRVFDQLRAKKLIPVIQLSALDYDKYEKQIREVAEFLNKFVWPIKYRYISVLNEPNSADFWYGRIAPDEYARVLDYTIQAFKDRNDDFYMINAGFNTSARTDDKNLDAFVYMQEMNQAVPGIFEKLDGWASHSYPQPNFSGKPDDKGRWSISAYDSELAYLRETLKVRKNLPVFITETGWAHAEGKDYNDSFLPIDKVTEHIVTAYKEIWLNDKRVRAVMPFTIWYEPPFDHFSWVNTDKVPYKHYNAVKSMKKIKGRPPTLKSNRLMINVCNVN
jgi:hypothetical protein